MYEDFNYIKKNGEWCHLEFESNSITVEDLRRFREYEATASRTFQVAVTTYVICSSPVHKIRTEITQGINTYRIKLIRLKGKNADQVFEKLEKKEKVGKKDILPVLLSPLMAGDLSLKVRIRKGLELIRRLDDGITKEEKIHMQSIVYALAVKLLCPEELKQVKEELFMTVLGRTLMDEGIARGLSQGLS